MAIDLAKSVPMRLRHLQDDGVDTVAFHALAALPGPFLPWTRFTLRPAALLAVLNDTVINDRRSIVECGSGNSTVYTARLLRQLGRGHITTIDHDERFAQVTRDALAREGLEDVATVACAPLVDGWYDPRQIPECHATDLLVVDGPPSYDEARRLARAPALGYFAASLVEGATVFLDDARRAGERDVLSRWERESGRTFVEERGGYAVSGPAVVAI
jgi:hypothetical protein